GSAGRPRRDEVHELLEPRVERRPGALGLREAAAGRAEAVAVPHHGLERGGEARTLVREAAFGARDLSRRHGVLRRDEARRADLPGLEDDDPEALEMRRQDERVGGLKEGELVLFAHVPERHDVVAVRESHPLRPREEERSLPATLAVCDPVGDELVDGLALADLTEIEHNRPARRVALAERRGVVPRRRIEADAEDLARDVRVLEPRLHERALLRREEAERARELEERAIRKKAERLLVVSGRDEPGALGDEREPRGRRLVDVRVEEDRVVGLALAVQELEKRGHVRPLRREPGALLVEGVRLEDEMALELLERRTAPGGDREAPYADRAVPRFARREMRRPAPEVERGRRRDLDLVQLREAVRDHACVGLGSAD